MSQVLVYGGAGQLGAAIITAFNEASFKTFSVDFKANEAATKSIIITGSSSNDVSKVVQDLGDDKFDCAISVAGGWAGGDVSSEGFIESVEKMWSFNVTSAVALSHVASKTLKEGALLILTGAQAALEPTPGMVAYGITKAATHHLLSSLAEGTGLPKGVTSAAILPITLDTATNRQGMPNADFSTWTPLETVSELLVSWTKEKPKNGSLVQLITKDNKTEFVPVA